MANHVFNKVYFEVPEEKFFDMKEELKESNEDVTDSTGEVEDSFDFNKIIPVPKEEEDKDSNEAHRKYWGTKWGACEVKWEFRLPKEVCITFLTAWTVPEKVMMKFVEKYKLAKMTHCYLDEMYSFYGVITYEFDNGIISADDNNERCLLPMLLDLFGFSRK